MIAVVFIACENKEIVNAQTNNIEPVMKSKEERRLEREGREKIFQQLIKDRREKFKDMLSENRVSGDIRGIWYMDGDDIKNMEKFLNSDIKDSDGYCIEISNNMEVGKIYFTDNEKIYNVKIKKLTETKYAMVYQDKKRTFDIIKFTRLTDKHKYSMLFFFEDFHKYNPDKGSGQHSDGSNFYDYCTSGINDYECSVSGCLGDIKERNEFGYTE